MAAYRRVYDSRHVQADCQEPGSCSSGTLRSVIECGLPLPFYTDKQTDDCVVMCPRSPSRRGGQYKQVCVEPGPSAVNATLPAFSAQRRRLLSTDISCPRGAQQQTCRTPLLLSIDGRDRQTDARPFHKPRSAYHAVLFFSRPRSEGWPHHGRTFSIYLCPLSF